MKKIIKSIDSSRSPQNIFIDPGMHIPAAKSTEVAIKANLNSGLNIGTAKTPIYALDSVHGYNVKDGTTKDENDTGITQFYTTSKNSVEVTEKGVDCASLFNGSGTGLNLREGQGIWVSYADAKYETNKAGLSAFDANNHKTQTVAFWGDGKEQKVHLSIVLNGVKIENKDIKSIDEAVNYINTFTVANDSRPGTGVKAVKSKDGSGIEFVNDNSNGTTDNMKNIDLTINQENTAGEIWTATWTNGQDGQEGKFTFKSQKEEDKTLWTATKTGEQGGTLKVTEGGETNKKVITAHKYIYSSSAQDLPPMYNPDGGDSYKPGTNGAGQPTFTDPASQNYYNAVHNGSLLNTDARTFHSTEDLRELLQRDARYGVDYDGSGSFAANDVNENVKVVVNDSGAFSITNPNETSKSPVLVTGGQESLDFTAHNMSFNITSYTDSLGKVSTNEAFTNIFKGFDGNLNVGNSNRKSEQLF
ncbi:flagellar hook protein FlgE, partial [Campylobacter molothri]